MMNYNENNNDPITESGGALRDTNSFIRIIAVMIICMFLIPLIMIVIYLYNFTDYGTDEFIKYGDETIPTLYKYTGYDDVFWSNKRFGVKQGDVKGDYVVIFYNNKIPTEYVEDYIEELQDEGFNEMEMYGETIYAKPLEYSKKGDTYLCVMVFSGQVKYGKFTIYK